MAHEFDGELVLNTEETAALVHNMLHPNIEACALRDEFIGDLLDFHIDLTNGEITVNCPEIQLPDELNQERYSLYDGRKLPSLELVEGKVEFEEMDESGSFNTYIFRDNEQSRYPVPSMDDEWMVSGNDIVMMILEAA